MDWRNAFHTDHKTVPSKTPPGELLTSTAKEVVSLRLLAFGNVSSNASASGFSICGEGMEPAMAREQVSSQVKSSHVKSSQVKLKRQVKRQIVKSSHLLLGDGTGGVDC